MALTLGLLTQGAQMFLVLLLAPGMRWFFRRRINVNAYETLESGSTTTTGVDIQSRTVLGIFSPLVNFYSSDSQRRNYFTIKSTESMASREPSSVLISCT